MSEKTYIAIDLKSFYASVECVERGLDPLKTNLVVADLSRTEKTIVLAVSPSLKAHGIPGRPRLFEVIQKVSEINAERKRRAPRRIFTGKSTNADELEKYPSLALDYIVAPPRMAKYMEFSTRIFNIYTKYVAPKDIHVYSVDEVFIDATCYLRAEKITAHQFALMMIRDVLRSTGITATAGIGTNLYLSKIAMDIIAKHIPADQDGVRIAELDEISYRKLLWDHRPLTDFWRIGHGYAKKLEENGIYTMGDIARCSLREKGAFFSEELLYKLFGINAELLIDHAWGYEPCTIDDIKSYRPETSSISSGQVLSKPYDFEKARLIVREMTELLVLGLVDKGLLTDQIVLHINYDASCGDSYVGEKHVDRYGRIAPKDAHGSSNLGRQTSSTKLIMKNMMALYDRIVDRSLTVRRVNIVANHIVFEGAASNGPKYEQLDIFTDAVAEERRRAAEQAEFDEERRLQKAVIMMKKRYGMNCILKGMDYLDGATTRERNRQIGGHRA